MKIWRINEKCLPLHSLLRNKPHRGEGIEIETLKDIELFDDEMLNKC